MTGDTMVRLAVNTIRTLSIGAAQAPMGAALRSLRTASSRGPLRRLG